VVPVQGGWGLEGGVGMHVGGNHPPHYGEVDLDWVGCQEWVYFGRSVQVSGGG